ncbi:MAG: CobW family GTP-binding protein [Pseudomonadota bacterium]|nr:CobW family GTP-binding protein [Pseudomonadota bacterium]
MPTPVHIIAGFLGAGKTTTIRAWMAANQGRERAAIIVNDFGEAGVDAALVSEGSDVSVTNIPGGCICCTAPAGLARAVAAVLDEVRPDRLFIEPSGLARPQDVVDMLTRGDLKDRVALGPTLVIVDPSLASAHLVDTRLVDTQLEAADVVVLNRVDLAPPDVLASFRARIATLWPGPARVLETSWGVLPADALAWPAAVPSEGAPPALRYSALPGGPSTEGFRARSWQFPPEVTVSWDKLRAVLTSTADIVRFKGIFHGGDTGWFRVDVAGGRLAIDGTAWRRDSRADLIVGPLADLDAFAVALLACIVETPEAPAAPGVTLVDLAGVERHLSRDALLALPGQVPDVSAVVAGRVGSGVLLQEVLALAAPPADARFVALALDGMASPPVPVSGVGGTLLVHSLGDAPLPENQGGPFRILVPTGQAPSSCANVKGVARLRLLPGSS